MFDFIAYSPPAIIVYVYDAPFVIKKEHNSYVLYIINRPIKYDFIYKDNNDINDKLLHIKIDKKSPIYNKIECAFSISHYNINNLDVIPSPIGGVFYSYNGKEIKLIDFNDCLKYIKQYAEDIYEKKFPDGNVVFQ